MAVLPRGFVLFPAVNVLVCFATGILGDYPANLLLKPRPSTMGIFSMGVAKEVARAGKVLAPRSNPLF